MFHPPEWRIKIYILGYSGVGDYNRPVGYSGVSDYNRPIGYSWVSDCNRPEMKGWLVITMYQ